jgi:hypothetical protein
VVLDTIVSGAISPVCIFFTNVASAIGPTVFEPPKKPFFIKYQSADIDLLLAKNRTKNRKVNDCGSESERINVGCTFS